MTPYKEKVIKPSLQPQQENSDITTEKWQYPEARDSLLKKSVLWN